jgi:solute carrier family 6 amino acid transporter-like protein 5/7/9/14
MFFMELALGQYSGCGPTRLFGRMAPIFKGLGYAMLLTTFFITIYYNVIMAWSVYYIFAGFQSELPWSQCNNESSKFCVDASSTSANVTVSMSPPEDYFTSVMLGYVPGETSWSNFGLPKIELVVCLFVAWLIVCLSLIKGVQSSGKVVYFTSIFPFVVLFILFVVGMTLEGAGEGIKFYVTPDFEKLKDFKVWSAAATQIFFSLGPAFGGLVTLASYNKFDNNCHSNAIFVSIMNCCTSVFAGFVVFSVLGFMAHNMGVTVEKVVQGGPTLAFVTFPDAVSKMPFPQIWSFLFFTMLITLGLDSMFTLVETLTTAIFDHFKSLRGKKGLVVTSVCSLGFLCGVSMCCPGGILMFTLIDATCADWNILLFALLEVVLVSWIYGAEKFLGNISEMGIKLPTATKYYWLICWRLVTPLILLTLLVLSFINNSEVKFSDYLFPDEVQAMGWLIGIATALFLPIMGGLQILKRQRKGLPLGLALFRPTEKWLPNKN